MLVRQCRSVEVWVSGRLRATRSSNGNGAERSRTERNGAPGERPLGIRAKTELKPRSSADQRRTDEMCVCGVGGDVLSADSVSQSLSRSLLLQRCVYVLCVVAAKPVYGHTLILGHSTYVPGVAGPSHVSIREQEKSTQPESG